jgi:hypothetical protein
VICCLFNTERYSFLIYSYTLGFLVHFITLICSVLKLLLFTNFVENRLYILFASYFYSFICFEKRGGTDAYNPEPEVTVNI